jgi:Domain of unknown function (DUF4160)
VLGDLPSIDLSKELISLQDEMATIDLLMEVSRPGCIEFLVKKHREIAIKMDANPNHTRPHIHVDYGNQHHIASYAIDTGEKLAGTSTYDRKIAEWIANNRQLLMEVWNSSRTAPPPDGIVASLKASAFG